MRMNDEDSKKVDVIANDIVEISIAHGGNQALLLIAMCKVMGAYVASTPEGAERKLARDCVMHGVNVGIIERCTGLAGRTDLNEIAEALDKRAIKLGLYK